MTASAGSAPAAMDRSAFLLTLSHFPRAVCLITSRSTGADHAATAATFAVVGFEPPTVAVSLHARSRLTAMIRDSAVWGVSLLAAHHDDLARQYARRGRPLGPGLAPHPVRRGPDTGVQLLEGALATLECRTVGAVAVEGHVLFLGRPVSGTGTDGQPLCDYHGALRSLHDPGSR